jgi:hypothetical protein
MTTITLPLEDYEVLQAYKKAIEEKKHIHFYDRYNWSKLMLFEGSEAIQLMEQKIAELEQRNIELYEENIKLKIKKVDKRWYGL